MSDCTICGGSGLLFDDTGAEKTCRCIVRRRIRLCLERSGLEDVSPMLGLVSFEGRRAKPINGHHIIRGGWDTVRSHVAGWLATTYLRDPKVGVTLTTDCRLRSMFLGCNPDSNFQSASSTLSSLSGVVVVRLRPIKHKATVPAIIEAMSYATVWIAEEPNLPFDADHPGWIDDMRHVLSEFQRIDLGDEDGEDVDLDAAMGVPHE